MSSWGQVWTYTRDNSLVPESYAYSRPRDLSTGKAGRHGLQNALISEIIKDGMTGPVDGTWILELGAGKGGLSLCLAETYADLRSACHFALVDRANSRRKRDSLLRSLGVSHQRIFIDLKDLDLDWLLPRHLERVVFAGKHLCGRATCLSLRAIAGLREKRPELYSAAGGSMLCSYDTFPQSGESRISEHDFDRIRRASSWHVCKNRIPQLPEDIDPAALGLYCKTFVDSSRLHFLSARGFRVQYFTYVDSVVSPENRIIVARSPPATKDLRGSDHGRATHHG